MRHYYPLGSAVNGRGFGNRSENPPPVAGLGVTGGLFTLVMALPGHLPSGDYWLIQRSLYTCSWAWGLLTRSIPYESPPLKVVVPLS